MRWTCSGLLLVTAVSLLGCYQERAPWTRTYLLARGEVPYGGPAVGFDLDGRVSMEETDACDDAPDRTSVRGEPGIDNSYGALVRTADTVDPTHEQMILAQIRGGEYLVLIEVSGIDSFDDDSSVSVRAYRGVTEAPEVLVADGMAVPDQTFVQVGEPFVDLPDGSASIVDGVLHFGGPSFPFRFGIGDDGIAIALRDARIRARITDDALVEGEVGGRVVVDEFVAVAPEPIDEALVRSLGLPDLDRDPTDPSLCHAFSFGFAFDAVLANPDE